MLKKIPILKEKFIKYRERKYNFEFIYIVENKIFRNLHLFIKQSKQRWSSFYEPFDVKFETELFLTFFVHLVNCHVMNQHLKCFLSLILQQSILINHSTFDSRKKRLIYDQA